MPREASRRSKITPEVLEEAARLRALWESRSHPSQAVFGEVYDIGNQSAVGQFLRGLTPMSIKAARGFAKGLNCEIADFSPRLAREIADIAQLAPSLDDDSEFVPIPTLSTSDRGIVEVAGVLKVARQWLVEHGIGPSSVRLLYAPDASMEPSIPKGAFLLLSAASTEPANNCVFALSHPVRGLLLRRLVRINGRWLARADNRDYSDIPMDDAHGIKLLGRAVYMGFKL